jgi:SAM-dependent methyltransferase
MNRIVEWIDRNFYPGKSNNWDDALFREHILRAMHVEHTVLDLGAGAGIIEHMNFKGRASKVCGIDLDPRVLDNPMLDEARVADGARIPYPDQVFDLVFADNVLEHLTNPIEVFSEAHRVLKPGGLFLFKTPNRWHYVPAIARMTPHRLHEAANRWRGRQDADIFPTVYRANSKGQVERLAEAAGLTVVALDRIESRPEYLRFSAPTYIAGALYERVVNLTPLLAAFRIVLIGTLSRSA